MSFGDTIKKLRKGRNLTQDQLANLLNVTPQAISRWENNSAMPDISLLVPLAHVFHVSTDELLEVNVEKIEQQIGAAIEKAVDFSDPNEDYIGLDSKIEYLRNTVRQFPEDNRLKTLLVGYLAGKLIHDAPYKDPAIMREQASLYEDMLEIGGTPLQQASRKANLVSIYKELGMTERICELVKDAHEMNTSREILIPDMLTGREQIEARKELIFKCTDAIILSIFAMHKDNTADLTDDEWKELERASHIVETVYGKDFADHFVLISELYNCAYAYRKRGLLDEAIEKLADIVRRLELMESAGSKKPALLTDKQYESLCITSFMESVRMKAKVILISLDKDWDAENMKESKPLFAEVYQKLERLSETETDVFQEYCKNTFTEYMLKDGRILN